MLAGYGNLSGLLFAVVFSGGLLSATTRDVWRIVGWCLLDAAAASATIAFVGFWVLATSAREVGHSAARAYMYTPDPTPSVGQEAPATVHGPIRFSLQLQVRSWHADVIIKVNSHDVP